MTGQRLILLLFIFFAVTTACRPGVSDYISNFDTIWSGSPSGPVAYDRFSQTFVAYDNNGRFVGRTRERGLVLDIAATRDGWRYLTRRDNSYFLAAQQATSANEYVLATPANRIWRQANQVLVGWDSSLSSDNILLVDSGRVYWDRLDGTAPQALNLEGTPEHSVLGFDEANIATLVVYAKGWLHVFRAGESNPQGQRLPLSADPSASGSLSWLAATPGRVALLFPNSNDLFIVRIPTTNQNLSLNIVTLSKPPLAAYADLSNDTIQMIVSDGPDSFAVSFNAISELLTSKRLPVSFTSANIAPMANGFLYWQTSSNKAIWHAQDARGFKSLDWGMAPNYVFSHRDWPVAIGVFSHSQTENQEGILATSELSALTPESGQRIRASLGESLQVNNAVAIGENIAMLTSSNSRLLAMSLSTGNLQLVNPNQWDLPAPAWVLAEDNYWDFRSITQLGNDLWLDLRSREPATAGIRLSNLQPDWIVLNPMLTGILDQPGERL